MGKEKSCIFATSKDENELFEKNELYPADVAQLARARDL